MENIMEIFSKTASTLIGAVIITISSLVIKVYTMMYQIKDINKRIDIMEKNFVTKIEFNKTMENIETNIKKIDKNVEKLIEQVYRK